MIVSFDDNVQKEIEEALPDSPSVQKLVTVGNARAGWEEFRPVFELSSDVYNDPQFLEGRQPNTMRGKELSWQIKRKWALLH